MDYIDDMDLFDIQAAPRPQVSLSDDGMSVPSDESDVASYVMATPGSQTSSLNEEVADGARAHGLTVPPPVLASSTDDDIAFARAQRYQLFDGHIELQIENTVFEVDKFFLRRDSEYFRQLFTERDAQRGHKELKDQNAILLSNGGIKLEGAKALDLERLLAILYPTDFLAPSLKSLAEWTSVLHAAHVWGMQSLRSLSIKVLGDIASPIDKVILGKQYGIRHWLQDAYYAISERPTAISADEGRQLGVDDVVQIAQAREARLTSGQPAAPASPPAFNLALPPYEVGFLLWKDACEEQVEEEKTGDAVANSEMRLDGSVAAVVPGPEPAYPDATTASQTGSTSNPADEKQEEDWFALATAGKKIETKKGKDSFSWGINDREPAAPECVVPAPEPVPVPAIEETKEDDRFVSASAPRTAATKAKKANVFGGGANAEPEEAPVISAEPAPVEPVAEAPKEDDWFSAATPPAQKGKKAAEKTSPFYRGADPEPKAETQKPEWLPATIDMPINPLQAKKLDWFFGAGVNKGWDNGAFGKWGAQSKAVPAVTNEVTGAQDDHQVVGQPAQEKPVAEDDWFSSSASGKKDKSTKKAGAFAWEGEGDGAAAAETPAAGKKEDDSQVHDGKAEAAGGTGEGEATYGTE